MVRLAQVGIALGALGGVLTLMCLFPGVTGINPAAGIGTVQIFGILVGFSLLIFGALIYVKFAFYVRQPSTLTQQIGIRLALTGLVFAALAGLADALGFGSHPRVEHADTYFGAWQAAGVVGSFLLSSVGVLIFALMGEPEEDGG